MRAWQRTSAKGSFIVALALWAGAANAQETLTLAKALELGKQRSPEMTAARARADSASASASSARAGYLPTLSASLQGQVIAVRDVQPAPPSGTQTAPSVLYTEAATGSAALRWTAWDFGKTSNAVAAADATANAAKAGVELTAAGLASDVATAYVTVYYKDELRAAAIQTVQNREKLVTFAKALVKSGLQPPVEEIRAAARLEAAKRDLATAEADALDARAGLVTLLRLDAPFRLAEPHLPSVEGDVARAGRMAEDKRETVKTARATAEARRAATDAARARYLPTLSINGDASYRFAQVDRFPEVVSNTRTLVGAIVLSGPLFDASISAGVDAADADAAAADATLAATTRDARGDAVRAALAVRTSDSVVEHAKKAADAAGNVFTIVEARYQQGLSTPLEVIDAETNDVDARTGRTTAELAHALAVVHLLVATGQADRIFQEAR